MSLKQLTEPVHYNTSTNPGGWPTPSRCSTLQEEVTAGRGSYCCLSIASHLKDNYRLQASYCWHDSERARNQCANSNEWITKLRAAGGCWDLLGFCWISSNHDRNRAVQQRNVKKFHICFSPPCQKKGGWPSCDDCRSFNATRARCTVVDCT